ncbi:MAG: hypothetical protein ACERLM_13050, partial [Acidimicrobiales bacterium]
MLVVTALAVATMSTAAVDAQDGGCLPPPDPNASTTTTTTLPPTSTIATTSTISTTTTEPIIVHPPAPNGRTYPAVPTEQQAAAQRLYQVEGRLHSLDADDEHARGQEQGNSFCPAVPQTNRQHGPQQGGVQTDSHPPDDRH